MNKVIAVAGVGATLIVGLLLGAGTAQAETPAEVFARHARSAGFENPGGTNALAARGLAVCVDFDLGYSPADVLARLLNLNHLSQRDGIEFAGLATQDLCPEYLRFIY